MPFRREGFRDLTYLPYFSDERLFFRVTSQPNTSTLIVLFTIPIWVDKPSAFSDLILGSACKFVLILRGLVLVCQIGAVQLVSGLLQRR